MDVVSTGALGVRLHFSGVDLAEGARIVVYAQGNLASITNPDDMTPAEIKTKREALKRYESQMRVMDWFLDGFARSNEVFSRPAPVRVVLPTRNSPCCER